MTKRCFKFASLFAVVAMLLGLMVTACTEGNNTPAQFNDSSETLLNTVVGISPEVTGKGYADAATKYLAVGVMNADGLVFVNNEAVAQMFSADGKIGAEAQATFGKDITAEAWKDLGNNEVLTSMLLTDSVLAQDPKGISVFAFDDKGTTLGMFTAPCNFNDKGLTTVDLVDEGSEFIKVEDLDSELLVRNVTDRVMSLYTGETKEVEAYVVFTYKGQKVGQYEVNDFTMTTESKNITVNNEFGTITGDVASEAKDNEVTLKWYLPDEGGYIEYYFNVDVSDLHVALTCEEGKFPNWTNSEYVTIDSVRVNDEEQLYSGEELTWDGTKSEYSTDTFYVFKDIPVKVGDKVAVHCVKHGSDGKVLEGQAEEITVTWDAVTNRIVVSDWRDVTELIRVSLVNDPVKSEYTLASGDVVVYDVMHNAGTGKTVVWNCDGKQNTMMVPCQAGDKVVVKNVRLYKGGKEPELVGLFADDKEMYAITATKGADNAAVIVKWAEKK